MVELLKYVIQKFWRISSINKTDALAVARPSRFKVTKNYYCSAWIAYNRRNKVAIRLKHSPLESLFLHFLLLYTYQATTPTAVSATTTPTTTPTIIHVVPTKCNIYQHSLYGEVVLTWSPICMDLFLHKLTPRIYKM